MSPVRPHTFTVYVEEIRTYSYAVAAEDADSAYELVNKEVHENGFERLTLLDHDWKCADAISDESLAEVQP